MDYRHLLGKRGENAAAGYLIRNKIKVLERNWRWRRAEIDLICMDGDTLVFIEVKTRHTTVHGPPELSISTKKRHLLMDAATRYMEKINHEWAIRFDVITVIIQNDQVMKIDHYPDSFSPWD